MAVCLLLTTPQVIPVHEHFANLYEGLLWLSINGLQLAEKTPWRLKPIEAHQWDFPLGLLPLWVGCLPAPPDDEIDQYVGDLNKERPTLRR